MPRRTLYTPALPDILEEGMQHHNRVVTQEAIRRQTLRYLSEDFVNNSQNYSQNDFKRISELFVKRA